MTYYISWVQYLKDLTFYQDSSILENIEIRIEEYIIEEVRGTFVKKRKLTDLEYTKWLSSSKLLIVLTEEQIFWLL